MAATNDPLALIMALQQQGINDPMLDAVGGSLTEDELLRMLMPAPQQTANDVMEMKLRSLQQGQKAEDWRNRGTYDYGGPLAGATRWMNRQQADKYQDKALSSLTQAMNAQSGIDQYQAQMERLRAAIAAQQERQEGREDFVFEEDYKRDNAPAPDKVRLLEWFLAQPPEVQAMLNQNGLVGSSGVTVNTGDQGMPQGLTDGLLNKGLMWDANSKSLVPIPGGPADKEQQDTERKDTERKAMIERAGTTVVQDFGRAKELIPELINLDGVMGANARIAASKVPGTAEWTFVKHVESGKSNIGLDRLQQMRENSPTGGALGQVPFQQQKRLEQVYGEVDVGMDIDTLTDNINRIQNIYTDIIYGSPEERALAVQEGKMTQEESDAVDQMYLDVSFDKMGQKTDEQIFVNPETGEKIRWDGKQWVTVQ